MRLRDRIRNGVNRMAESLEVFKKDVFELEGVPAFREYYQLFIFVWQAIYKGFYKAWHEVPVKTPNDPKGKKRTMATMNAGKMACSQMARYVWNERCAITASMADRGPNSETPDPLNEFLQHVLHDNRFGMAFGDLLEKSFALGGGALKEWVEIPKDENGNDVGPGKIRLSYHMAGQFVPTAWDNSRITCGIFINREARDGYYYSTVEWHKWDGTTYRVTNDVYRMPIKQTDEPQNILGWWYPLNMIYPLLSPSTDLKVSKTAFQYLRPFGANTVDDNSPLGMSVYAPAMDTLKQLDEAFDSLGRELRLGRKRIIVPARAVKHIVDNQGQHYRYFDTDDEVYQTLELDDSDALKIHDNSVGLRISEHTEDINAHLSMLCAQIGFDPGILSFDFAQGMKTATEVISQNSKTFTTVQNHQNNMRDALESMVDSILELAANYGITYKGQSIATLVARGYNKAVIFDDSIVQDRQSNIDEGIKLYTNNLMSKKHFMMKVLGYTEEQALAEIQAIADEQQVSVSAIDNFFSGVET